MRSLRRLRTQTRSTTGRSRPCATGWGESDNVTHCSNSKTKTTLDRGRTLAYRERRLLQPSASTVGACRRGRRAAATQEAATQPRRARSRAGSSDEQPRDDELLTPSEVAEVLGINARTVSRWARDGLPCIHTLGGHRRLPWARRPAPLPPPQ